MITAKSHTWRPRIVCDAAAGLCELDSRAAFGWDGSPSKSESDGDTHKEKGENAGVKASGRSVGLTPTLPAGACVYAAKREGRGAAERRQRAVLYKTVAWKMFSDSANGAESINPAEFARARIEARPAADALSEVGSRMALAAPITDAGGETETRIAPEWATAKLPWSAFDACRRVAGTMGLRFAVALGRRAAVPGQPALIAVSLVAGSAPVAGSAVTAGPDVPTRTGVGPSAALGAHDPDPENRVSKKSRVPMIKPVAAITTDALG
jgi:hypothetical protein